MCVILLICIGYLIGGRFARQAYDAAVAGEMSRRATPPPPLAGVIAAPVVKTFVDNNPNTLVGARRVRFAAECLTRRRSVVAARARSRLVRPRDRWIDSGGAGTRRRRARAAPRRATSRAHSRWCRSKITPSTRGTR